MFLIGCSLLLACYLLNRWVERYELWMKLPDAFFLLLIVLLVSGLVLVAAGLLPSAP